MYVSLLRMCSYMHLSIDNSESLYVCKVTFVPFPLCSLFKYLHCCSGLCLSLSGRLRVYVGLTLAHSCICSAPFLVASFPADNLDG